MQQPLDLASLKIAAAEYAAEVSASSIPSLYGVTDGKAVGTYVEAGFNVYIARHYVHHPGNAARGIDFPDLNVDLKVTSIKQPQSSCPFRDATQKLYGLGYHLLLIVYNKVDDQGQRSAVLDIQHIIFIEQATTPDYTITRGVRALLAGGANLDDVDAYLEDRNLPLDPESRRQLAQRVLDEPPALGILTISNALQWRLQYGRAISAASSGLTPT